VFGGGCGDHSDALAGARRLFRDAQSSVKCSTGRNTNWYPFETRTFPGSLQGGLLGHRKHAIDQTKVKNGGMESWTYALEIVNSGCQRRSNSPQIRRSKSPQFRRSEPRVSVAIFGWPTTPTQHWRRSRWGDGGFRADMLGHKFGMLAQPVAIR
jgi:hypothetical protein